MIRRGESRQRAWAFGAVLLMALFDEGIDLDPLLGERFFHRAIGKDHELLRDGPSG